MFAFPYLLGNLHEGENLFERDMRFTKQKY